MAKVSNAFNRANWHYTIVWVAALVCGGWLLTENVELSKIGFINVEGWPLSPATTACWAMAAAEAGVMILATAPEYWDDIYRALVDFGGDDPDRVPRFVRFILIGLVGAVVLGIVAVVYWFDFRSTHMGLYGEAPVTAKTGAFTLFFNVGSEVLAFIAGQVRRLGKLARRRALQEAVEVEPQVAYGEHMLVEMKDFSRERAAADSRKMWDAFYRQNPHVPKAGHGGRV
jgi:hypothetical protein